MDIAASYVGGKLASEISDKIATKAGNAIVSKIGKSMATPKRKKLFLEQAAKETGKSAAGDGLSAGYIASISGNVKKKMTRGSCRKLARRSQGLAC